MKKFFLFLLMTASIASAKEVSVKPFLKLKVFQDPSVTLERVYDQGSVYQIQFSSMTPQGKRLFDGFITKDKKVMIVGNGVEIDSQQLLKMPLDVAALKKNADIVYGTGKKEYIVVTDPECFYCQKFQKRWESIKSKYKFYVYLYPLGHHAQAARMSYYVLGQKSHAQKAKALIAIAEGSKTYQGARYDKKMVEKFNKKLDANSLVGDSLGVRGTPAVFNFNGDFVNWANLVK